MIVVLALVVGACGTEAKKPRQIPKGAGRPTAKACPETRPPGKVQEGQGECKTDAECTNGKNGRCMTVGSRVRENKCTYDACIVDADCPKGGGPCECGEQGNVCLAGNCQVDADCGAGGACVRSSDRGCFEQHWSNHCVTAEDTCEPVGEDECKKGSTCLWSNELKHFTCVEEERCPVG